MPDNYREFLKRFGSFNPIGTVNVKASEQVHWPPDVAHDDIDSLSWMMEAANDIMNSSWKKAMDYYCASGCVPNLDITRRERRSPASELNDYLRTLYTKGYKVSFSQADAFDDLHIEMTTKDASLKALLSGDSRYDPRAIKRRVETMKSTMDLLDEEDEQ